MAVWIGLGLGIPLDVWFSDIGTFTPPAWFDFLVILLSALGGAVGGELTWRTMKVLYPSIFRDDITTEFPRSSR